MAELELGPLRFGIIGAGRLGTVIARGLQAARLDVVAATSASAAGRSRAARALQVPVFDDPLLATVDADVVIVCVPDDSVPALAERLARRDPQTTPYRLRIVHTSGCVGLAPFDALRQQGHDVLSVHPLQTVTATTSASDLAGAAAAVTAHDVAAATFGHALAHALGMHPFDLADEVKPLYHAASSFAANFTVTVMAAVRDITRQAGMHEQMSAHAFASLARSAVDRVEREGPEAALTGPIVRGDAVTVGAHLRALDEQLPGHAELYRHLARATATLAVSSGALPMERAQAINAALARGETGAGGARDAAD